GLPKGLGHLEAETTLPDLLGEASNLDSQCFSCFLRRPRGRRVVSCLSDLSFDAGPCPPCNSFPDLAVPGAHDLAPRAWACLARVGCWTTGVQSLHRLVWKVSVGVPYVGLLIRGQERAPGGTNSRRPPAPPLGAGETLPSDPGRPPGQSWPAGRFLSVP